jgi:hypothetical protein
VFPLLSRSYKFSATLGAITVVATPLRAILDTGAVPYLIREDMLTDDWEHYRIADAPVYKIFGAGGHRLNQKGLVTLVVQLWNLGTKARFIVVAGLAADCILGGYFIDLNVKNILPGEKHVRRWTTASIRSWRIWRSCLKPGK